MAKMGESEITDWQAFYALEYEKKKALADTPAK
jgi:hypothetical protein